MTREVKPLTDSEIDALEVFLSIGGTREEIVDRLDVYRLVDTVLDLKRRLSAEIAKSAKEGKR